MSEGLEIRTGAVNILYISLEITETVYPNGFYQMRTVIIFENIEFQRQYL
jgi:hypothetical protein